MRIVAQAVFWFGILMLAACAVLFLNYFAFGVKPNYGDVDFWRGPVLPFFLLMAGILVTFTGFMIKGAFAKKDK